MIPGSPFGASDPSGEGGAGVEEIGRFPSHIAIVPRVRAGRDRATTGPPRSAHDATSTASIAREPTDKTAKFAVLSPRPRAPGAESFALTARDSTPWC